MNETVLIYLLRDPSTRRPRYVGMTRRPAGTIRGVLGRRLTGHLTTLHVHSPKAAWLRSVVDQGGRPTIELLEEVPWPRGRQAEIRWIEYLVNRGEHLTNVSHVSRARQRCPHCGGDLY